MMVIGRIWGALKPSTKQILKAQEKSPLLSSQYVTTRKDDNTSITLEDTSFHAPTNTLPALLAVSMIDILHCTLCHGICHQLWYQMRSLQRVSLEMVASLM